MTVQQLTETAHQINRLFHQDMGEYDLLEWEHLPEEKQQELIKTVTIEMYKQEVPETEDFFILVVHELKKFVK